MADKRHASIETKDWFHHLDGLALLAGATPAGDEAHLIRLFLNLLERAPAPEWIEGLVLPDALNIESYLSVAAHDHAALSFLGETASFCFSRGGEQGYLASVLLPGALDEKTASGASIASSVIAAMSLALCETISGVQSRPAQLGAGSGLLH